MRQQIDFYDRGLRVIGSSGGHVVSRGMNVAAQRGRYLNPYPPHDVVLGHLLKSISHTGGQHGHKVVVVDDEVHAEERHRTKIRNNRCEGTARFQSSVPPR